MKKYISLIAVMMFAVPAVAAPAGRARPSMASQMIMAAPRATVSVNQLEAMSSVRVDATMPSGTTTTTTPEPEEPAKDMREKERAACLNNNVGLGNTFVWASRFSNVANYHSMIEDVEEPANNTCFVRVEMRSNDSRISVNDVQPKYFEMGTPVTCGSWVNEETMRQRILDAKKSARVWATVGATVGGAGLGVGIMELFGNKLIGGKVEGQAGMEGTELLRSQMLTMKQEESEKYNQLKTAMTNFVSECRKEGADTLPECKDVANYETVLSAMPS